VHHRLAIVQADLAAQLNHVSKLDEVWAACYRSVYDPSPRAEAYNGSFKQEVQDRHYALRLVGSTDVEMKHKRLEQTLLSLLNIVETASPEGSKNAWILRSAFAGNSKAERFYLHREPLQEPSTEGEVANFYCRAWSTLARKLSQKLHVSYGLTIMEATPSATQADIQEAARGVVYQAASYQTGQCTPIRIDDTVDWRILESLFICSRLLWLEMAHVWHRRQPHLLVNLSQSPFDRIPAPPVLGAREGRDWAGVTKDTWIGI
jgi:hypothetical protein